MDGVLHLGPLIIAADRLIAVGALWSYLFLATRHARRHPEVDGRVPWVAALAGIVVARLAFVLQNRTAFEGHPLEGLYLWQSGFLPLFGIAAGAVTLALVWKGPGRLANLTMLSVVGSLALVALQLLPRDAARPFPDGLVAMSMRGEQVSPKQLLGKPFVVNLWATWCPPCVRELPMIAETMSASLDVPILAVNQGETSATVHDFLDREKLGDANMLLDPAGAFGAAIGSEALPTTIFVDASGKIRRIHAGAISRAALLAGIQEIKEKHE